MSLFIICCWLVILIKLRCELFGMYMGIFYFVFWKWFGVMNIGVNEMKSYFNIFWYSGVYGMGEVVGYGIYFDVLFGKFEYFYVIGSKYIY